MVAGEYQEYFKCEVADDVKVYVNGSKIDFDVDQSTYEYENKMINSVSADSFWSGYDFDVSDDGHGTWTLIISSTSTLSKHVNPLTYTFTGLDPTTWPGDMNGDQKYDEEDIKELDITYKGQSLDFDPYADTVTLPCSEDDFQDTIIEYDNGWTVRFYSTAVSGIVALPDGSFSDPAVRADYYMSITAPDGTGFSYDIVFTDDAEDDDVDESIADSSEATTDSTYTTADLKDVTVAADGETIDFDPDTHEYEVTDPSTVSFDNLPDGWTANSMTNDDGSVTWTLTAPDGITSFDYTFTTVDDAMDEDETNSDETTTDGDSDSTSDDADATTTLAQTGVSIGGVLPTLVCLLAAGIKIRMTKHRRLNR